jgi:5-methylcytosine-specific restriction endonuclease McrA
MTEAQFRGWIVAALRDRSRWWKPKQKAKRAARLPKKYPDPKTGRIVFHSTCAGCGEKCPEKDVQMDHIVPIVDPAIGFVSWDVYIERMFIEDGYQALCPTCHKEKTARERAISTERKRNERKAKSLKDKQA